jgi:hypothetical protein
MICDKQILDQVSSRTYSVEHAYSASVRFCMAIAIQRL